MEKILKMKKIEILDWENLSIEDYIKRCERDVEINVELFQNQLEYLLNLYSNEGRSNKACSVFSLQI